MNNYLNLIEKILLYGEPLRSRNGIRVSLIGETLRYDLTEGFPVVTTRKLFWRGIVEELFWFLDGSTDVKELSDKGVHIWDNNTLGDGTIGLGYGFQWRGLEVDQISRAIFLLTKQPTSTRIIVNAWNVEDIDDMSLPPCHYSFQFISNGKQLSTIVNIRSSDVPLGLPFNIASYALLTHIMAKRVGMEVRDLVINIGHAHIYKNQIKMVHQQIGRFPYPLPELVLEGQVTDNLMNLGKYLNPILSNYQYHPRINYPFSP